ncbi:MAG TPA: CoA transferase, partial [Nakamurella sp.]
SGTCDLPSHAGRELLTRLAGRGDVLVENFRPGVLDRLGFPLERLTELNPGLVVLSISGFGHDGPEGGRAGYDQIAQGEAGLMSMTGPDPETPTKVGVPIADLLAGMYGAFGVVAKLNERARTGLGGRVRTSLLASVVGVHAFQGTRWTVAGQVPKAEGPHHPSICPYGLFHSADGTVQIAVGSEGLWQRLAPAFDLPLDAPGFATNSDRVRNGPAVREAVNQAFAAYKSADLLAKLAEIGVPSGEVKNLQQVFEWDQTRSQGLLIDVEHPVLGPVQLPGPPLRFFDGAGDEWHREHTAPPLLGQHTDDVLAWLAEEPTT